MEEYQKNREKARLGDERLVTSAKQASQKSVKDFFGTLDSESAAQMEEAVRKCRKVDLNEW